MLSVKDTGIGIKTEDMASLFDSFTRLEEGRNRAIEGTGLGLNLTRALAELMDGTISVESVYGKGSTFKAVLPQIIKSNVPVGDFNKRLKEIDLSEMTERTYVYAPKCRILVVDDVEMNLFVAKGLLKYTGAVIDTASSGMEALDLVAKNSYEIIFLDHLMPKMDGVETLKKMMEFENSINAATPIIMMTANAIAGAKEEYIKDGFTDYIAKPIVDNKFQEILKKYLPQDKFTVVKSKSTEENSKEEETVAVDFSEDIIEIEPYEEEVLSGKNDASEFPSFIKEIDFLDTETGLKFCLSDINFYRQILNEFITADKTLVLNAAFVAKNWSDYKIYVHALKSTSLNIGAIALSNAALEMEEKCKLSDTDYIISHHDELMEMYGDILKKLKRRLMLPETE